MEIEVENKVVKDRKDYSDYDKNGDGKVDLKDIWNQGNQDNNQDNNNQDNTNQDNTNQDNANQDNTNQGNTNQGDTNQGDTNQGDTNQGDTNQGDTNQGDTNQGDTNQGDTNQDNTNQDNTNQDNTNQDNTDHDSNDGGDNTGGGVFGGYNEKEMDDGNPSTDGQDNPGNTDPTEETEVKAGLGDWFKGGRNQGEDGTVQPGEESSFGGSFLMIGGILLVLILAACAVVMYIRKNEQKKRRRARRNNRTAVAAAAPAAAHTAAPMAAGYAKAPVAAAAYQHIGAREDQQDSYGVSRPELYGRQGVMAVVADGMGGLANGKAVSSALVRTYLDGFPQVSGYYEQTSDILLDLAIRSNAQVNKMLQGAERSGSTLVATMIRGGYLHFLTVGDSRVYLCRGGALIQLNREHIYQEELAAKAVNQSVAMNQIRTDRQAHSLTSYFGIGRIPSIDRNDEGLKLVPGDRILLASDGVFGTLTQEQMEQALQHEINEAAQLMGDMILNADKPYQDNNTLVILEYNG